MFSDNYINLCAKKNETVTTAAEHIGFSRTSGQKWANGSVPRKTTLKRIADYFGITVDELIAEKEKPTTINGSELSEDEAFLISFFRKLSPARQRYLIDQLKGKLLEESTPGDL